MSMEQVLLDRTHALTDTGLQPGSFTTHLLNAFGSADAQNSRRLSSVFPHLGAAVFIIKNFDNGAEMLAGRVR